MSQKLQEGSMGEGIERRDDGTSWENQGKTHDSIDQRKVGILGRSEWGLSSCLSEEGAWVTRDMFAVVPATILMFPLWIVQRTPVPLQFHPPATPSSKFQLKLR